MFVDRRSLEKLLNSKDEVNVYGSQLPVTGCKSQSFLIR